MKIWSRRIAQNMNKYILGNATTSYFHYEISWPLAVNYLFSDLSPITYYLTHTVII